MWRSVCLAVLRLTYSDAVCADVLTFMFDDGWWRLCRSLSAKDRDGSMDLGFRRGGMGRWRRRREESHVHSCE